MNVEIVKKYKINFQNKLIFGREVDKTPYTGLDLLSMFLYECKPIRIEESLLPKINEALNGINSDIEDGTELVDLIINKDTVVLSMDNGEENTIPTLEFKEIVEGWRAFLLLPPSIGTIL